MNQILVKTKSKLKIRNLYLIQFLIILLILFFLIIHIAYIYFIKKYSENISTITFKSRQLSELYRKDTINVILINNIPVSIIGYIDIPSINIYYPILSEYSDELLKISVCKFYGPNINENGNLCIAGHNYNNNIFFSKLFLLKIGDKIYIKDINSNQSVYSIYDMYEIDSKDLSFISQNTNRYTRINTHYL